MNGTGTVLHVQIAYNQGLVKTFFAPTDVLLCDFVDVARSFGRFRSVRFGNDVERAEAERQVREGQATMVEVKRG